MSHITSCQYIAISGDGSVMTATEQEFKTTLLQLIAVIEDLNTPVKNLTHLSSLVKRIAFNLKLKVIVGRGGSHIWIKREENLHLENWITITIES
jgi:exosome complex RNA-binding protein Rrp4